MPGRIQARDGERLAVPGWHLNHRVPTALTAHRFGVQRTAHEQGVKRFEVMRVLISVVNVRLEKRQVSKRRVLTG